MKSLHALLDRQPNTNIDLKGVNDVASFIKIVDHNIQVDEQNYMKVISAINMARSSADLALSRCA